jgi:hypothetical protein
MPNRLDFNFFFETIPLDFSCYPFHNVEFIKEPLIRKDATEAHVRRFVMQQYWYIQLKTDCANN